MTTSIMEEGGTHYKVNYNNYEYKIDGQIVAGFQPQVFEKLINSR
jgi:hypothetical protein